MNMAFFKRNRQWILCNIILLICFIAGFGRFGDVMVDSFREAYIPTQMLEGERLYKDIFVIYPPLEYLINAFLFFIFGTKLRVLYFAGFAAALGIINLTFKLASEFMHKNHALAVTLFVIFAAAISPNVFNIYFPYSFGILYGVLFILGSIYCVLKKEFAWAYLFCSLALCSKYEFILFLPVLMFMSGKRGWLKNLAAFFTPIILTLGILFVLGVTFESILTSAKWMVAMSSAKTLYWFYSVSGLVFRPQLIPIYLVNFLKYFVPLLVVCYFRNIWVITLTIVYLWFFVNPEILIYAFPLILVMYGLQFRKLSTRKRFFIAVSLLISIKIFFALTLQSYGIYFLPFALISIYILTPVKYKKALYILILSSALIIGIKNSTALNSKNFKLETPIGKIYTTPYYGEGLDNTIKYLRNNSEKTDRVLVLPEGLVVNILADRKSDSKFYSLIPLYAETFGDELIEKRLDYVKPEYIVITNYDTSNYYYSRFGGDYTEAVYEYILKNYDLVKTFGDKFTLNIFKIKKH